MTDLARVTVQVGKECSLAVSAGSVDASTSSWRSDPAIYYASLATIAFLATCIVVLIIYIRARQRDLIRVRSSEMRLGQILEAIPLPTLVLDADHNITHWNAAAEVLTGRTAAEMTGSPYDFRTFPNGRRTLLADHVLDGTDPGQIDSEQRSGRDTPVRRSAMVMGALEVERYSDGLQPTGRWLRTFAAALRDANGVVTGAVETSIDVSEERQARIELETSKQQLENNVAERTQALKNVNEALQRAKDAADAGARTKSDFVANISHEIRNPLNAIAGMAYLIRRSGVNAEQENYLEKLDQASRYLKSIVNSVLDLSKIESGKLMLEEVCVDIDAVVANVADMLSEQIQEKQLEWIVHIDEDLSLLVGDATRIQQALLNYAANAIKFTDSGSVTVRVCMNDRKGGGDLVLFEVRDTGVGIDPHTAARLFTPFEQADNSITRQYGGTGLGLSITRKLAQAMGGDAGVISEAGVGSTFWFTAQLRRADSAESAESGFGIFSSKADITGILRSRRVLVVEDEAVNREILLAMLEDAGPTIDIACNGKEAVELARSNDYALIIMDIQMPVMDGIDATRRIRAMAHCAAIPIIAMTGNAFAEDRRLCLQAGMSDLVAKPIDYPQFRTTLLRWN